MAQAQAYVADTHALAWYFADDPRLGATARTVLERAQQNQVRVWVPTIALYELLSMARKGKLPWDNLDQLWYFLAAPPGGAAGFHTAAFDELVFDQMLDLVRQQQAQLEMNDLVLVATALIFGAPLITKDQEIIQSGLVPIAW